ncbi:MAG: hypothetical protein MK101_05915 [Phycisphaerales bacterium]|nr:hypothetical protein [Phycisphaerales bacterium]
MCRDIDASKPQTIVELGAGVGPVTAMISKLMHPQSRFLSIELDPDLHELAQERCPEVDIQLGSADQLDEFLDDRGIDKIDCFLSCLPVPSLPKTVNSALFECWKRRCSSGVFTQITQIPWYYRRMYRRVFDTVEFKLVPMNFLPAGVYHCSQLRADFEADDRLPGH